MSENIVFAYQVEDLHAALACIYDLSLLMLMVEICLYWMKLTFCDARAYFDFAAGDLSEVLHLEKNHAMSF
jgi:hypothetical protein